MERPYELYDLREASYYFSVSDEEGEMILEILNDSEIPAPDLIDGYPIFGHEYVAHIVYKYYDDYDRPAHDEFTEEHGSSIMAVWKSVGLLIEIFTSIPYNPSKCRDRIRIYRFDPAEEFKVAYEDEVYGDYECHLRGAFVKIMNIELTDSFDEDFSIAHTAIKTFFKFNEFQKILAASRKRAEKFKSLLVKYATLRKVQKYPAFQYSECQERYNKIVKQAGSACAYLNWCLENYSQGIDEQRDKESFEAVQQACKQLEELYDNPPFHYEDDYEEDNDTEDYERGEWRDGKYYPDWLGGSESEEDFWEH